MKCPNCHYQLTENEILLCTVGTRHYCPRCWATIPNDKPKEGPEIPVKVPPVDRGPRGPGP